MNRNSRFHVVLVHPEIPQNTGAIGRLCVCMDAHLHLIKPLGFVIDASHLKRAGLDYWNYLRYSVHDNWECFLRTEQPEQLFFSSTKGAKHLYDYRFRTGEYLVFGNESKGLPTSFYDVYSDNLYGIPMPGRNARSLNLANAVSVVLYEAYRQTTITIDSQPNGNAPLP